MKSDWAWGEEQSRFDLWHHWGPQTVTLQMYFETLALVVYCDRLCYTLPSVSYRQNWAVWTYTDSCGHLNDGVSLGYDKVLVHGDSSANRLDCDTNRLMFAQNADWGSIGHPHDERRCVLEGRERSMKLADREIEQIE